MSNECIDKMFCRLRTLMWMAKGANKNKISSVTRARTIIMLHWLDTFPSRLRDPIKIYSCSAV